MSTHKKYYTHDGITMRNEFRIDGDICWISLTQGKETCIDKSSIDLVKDSRWYSKNDKKDFYVVARHNNPKIRGMVYMHRAILSAPTGMSVDHRNHLTLDNRLENIRIVTQSGNCLNMKGFSKSGYLGVYPNGRRWQAEIKINGKNVHVANCKTPREAGIARSKAFVAHFGPDINPDQTTLSKEIYKGNYGPKINNPQ